MFRARLDTSNACIEADIFLRVACPPTDTHRVLCLVHGYPTSSFDWYVHFLNRELYWRYRLSGAWPFLTSTARHRMWPALVAHCLDQGIILVAFDLLYVPLFDCPQFSAFIDTT